MGSRVLPLKSSGRSNLREWSTRLPAISAIKSIKARPMITAYRQSVPMEDVSESNPRRTPVTELSPEQRISIGYMDLIFA